MHFRLLDTDTGVPVGPPNGTDIGDDPDVFGTQSAAPGSNGASVSFADTSTANGLGQLFAVHNDGSDIQIAHFDEADGSLVQELDVLGTAGMTVESSLLATPPVSDGSRSLFFVAGGRLFKVPVADAQSRNATFGTPTSTADVNATPLSSPTLVYLRLLGTPTAHVAIGTEDGDLRTYRALSEARRVIVRARGEDAPPTVAFTRPATDTAGQTGAALRNVNVSRFTPAGVSARVSPSRDPRAPFSFRTRGSVRLPDGVARSAACGSGFVSVQVKAGRKTISNRRTSLTRACAFSSSVSFRIRERFTRSGRLSVRVRFLGNAVLAARRARVLTVRTR